MIFSDNDICSGCICEDGKDKSQCKIKNKERDIDCPCIECLLKCIGEHPCSAYTNLLLDLYK